MALSSPNGTRTSRSLHHYRCRGFGSTEGFNVSKVSFKAPNGFDPRNAAHVKQVMAALAKDHGEGWRIVSYDVATCTIHASRAAAITETTVSSGSVREVGLPANLRKPSAGEQAAAELSDTYPGFVMTTFDPHLGKAVIKELTDDEIRARGAVAVALGVKPWDVQIKGRIDGGFDLELPRTYVPSRHDDKLNEVAESIIGHPGWYAHVDAKTLTGSLIPGSPPTFPGAIPLKGLKGSPRDRVALGWKLAKPGGNDGEPMWLDFEAAPHAMLSGTSGSGKSVLLNTLIASALAGGSELVIADVPHKAVDFAWCKDFCRDGGWGCDSLRATVAAITMVYREGERRARELAEAEVTKWTEMPPGRQFAPILVLVDEVTGLIQLDDVPKGLPKDHTLVMEAQESNLLRQTLLGFMKKIAAEMRFVGIRLVLSSQVSSVNTGVPTALRMNLANKVLLGSNPTPGNRKLALSDPTSVPEVPAHVRSDDKASRGVGVAEFEAQTPEVFKSFYAATTDLREMLETLGVPKSSRPAPTSLEIARHTPSLDDESDSPRGRSQPKGPNVSPVSGRSLEEIGREMGDPNVGWDVDPETGRKLTGFERANAARHQVVKGS